MSNVREQFINLKNTIIKENTSEKTVLEGLDIILEVLADREYIKSGSKSVKRWTKLNAIHNLFKEEINGQ